MSNIEATPHRGEADQSAGGPSRGKYRVIINGRPLPITDGTPQGDQLLAEGGFEPVDDHVLIRKMRKGSQLVTLDQVVELDRNEPAVFYAFRGGDVWMLTVDTHSYQWGRPTITEEELREFADVPKDQVLVQQRDDDVPLVVEPKSSVPLKRAGTEHFRIEDRMVVVSFDGEERSIPRGMHTTEQLIELLHVEAGYLLNLQTKNGLETLKPGQLVQVKKGMVFFSQAPGGGSS